MENIFCINFYKNLFILKKKVWRKLKILHIFLVLANFVTREKPRIYDICNVILILKTFQKNWSLVLNVFKFKYSFSEKNEYIWMTFLCHLLNFNVLYSIFNRSANVENHLKFRPTLNVKQLLNWWSISKETSFFRDTSLISCMFKKLMIILNFKQWFDPLFLNDRSRTWITRW